MTKKKLYHIESVHIYSKYSEKLIFDEVKYPFHYRQNVANVDDFDKIESMIQKFIKFMTDVDDRCNFLYFIAHEYPLNTFDTYGMFGIDNDSHIFNDRGKFKNTIKSSKNKFEGIEKGSNMFNVGDIVEFVYSAQICIGIVAEIPLTKEDDTGWLDEFDNTYLVYFFDNDERHNINYEKLNHIHISESFLMQGNYQVSENFVNKLKTKYIEHIKNI